MALYRRALGLRPEWAEGWWYLGMLRYDADQFRDAIPAFERVLELAPDAPGTLTFLGLCEFETGDYDSALKHLERASAANREDDPQLTQVVSYHLALLLNRAGKFDRAQAILAKDFSVGSVSDQVTLAFGLNALHVPLVPREVDPSWDALVQSVGRLALLIAQGRAAQAAEGYPALLRQHPDVPYLHGAYAAALASAGHREESAEQLQLESKLHPENPSWSPAIAAFYGNAATRARLGLSSPSGATDSTNPEQDWQLAKQLFSAEKYAEAIPPLKVTLAAHPEMGTAWGMLGLAEFETQDYENALLHLQKGTALGLGGSPDSVRLAKYRLGLLLIRKSRFDQAAAMLVPEAHGDSLATEVRFALGLALLHKDVWPEAVPSSEINLVQSAGEISLLLHNSKYDAAFPKLEELIKAHPTTPMLHYVYGIALFSFSRFDEAAAQFAAESRVNPESELPYVQGAFVELEARRPADALVFAQHAVELAPHSAEAHYVLGRSLLDSGKFADAVKELEAAAKINPGSPEVHFNLAKAYAKLGRQEDARRERQRFGQLNSEIERQRSESGSQAYGAAHTASELSRGSKEPSMTSPSPP